MEQRCDNEPDDLDKLGLPSGTIAFVYGDGPEGVWSTSQFIADAELIWPSAPPDLSSISPNAQQMAMMDESVSPPLVTILPANGLDVHQWPWLASWGRPRLFWFDNQRLAGSGESELPLISVETGLEDERVAPPQFDDMSQANGALLLYDPQLTRIAYSGLEYELVVRELESGQLISRTSLQLELPPGGEWSPNGNLFVFSAFDPARPRGTRADLYLLDANSSVTRLTDLSLLFKEFRILDMIWSPDQRSIAIWAQSALHGEEFDEDLWKLYVFNLEDYTIYDYCIINQLGEQGHTRWDLTWSPDSQSMLTRLSNSVPDRIVDINTGEVLQFPADILVLLWGD